MGQSDTIPLFPGGDNKHWQDWRMYQFKFLLLVVFQIIYNHPLLLNSFVWFLFLPFLVVLNNIHSILHRKISCCIIIFDFLFFFFLSRAAAAIGVVLGQTDWWNPSHLYFILLLSLCSSHQYSYYPGWQGQ